MPASSVSVGYHHPLQLDVARVRAIMLPYDPYGTGVAQGGHQHDDQDPQEGAARVTPTKPEHAQPRDKVTILLPHDLVLRARMRAADLSVASMADTGSQVHFQDVVKLALEAYLK